MNTIPVKQYAALERAHADALRLLGSQQTVIEDMRRQMAASSPGFLIPKGFRLYPKQATRRMEAAAEDYWKGRRFGFFSVDPRTWAGIWQAMTATAPDAEIARLLSEAKS